MKNRSVRWPVKLGLITYLLLTFLWSLPEPSPDFLEGKLPANQLDSVLISARGLTRNPPISTFYFGTGLWQYWDMFGPDPISQNSWFEAKVTLADNQVVVVQYPRMEELTIPDKYLHERFLKYSERVQLNSYSYLWPTWANWFARKAWSQSENPPVTVQIIKHYQWIADQGKPRNPWAEEVIFDHVVSPQDLGLFPGDKP